MLKALTSRDEFVIKLRRYLRMCAWITFTMEIDHSSSISLNSEIRLEDCSHLREAANLEDNNLVSLGCEVLDHGVQSNKVLAHCG